MNTAFTLDPGRFVQHPAGHDGELRGAVEELQRGRWMAARALLAATWGNWPAWTSRTQILASVAAHTDVLDHWAAADPANTGLVTLRARVAVEQALMTRSQPADPRRVALLEQAAREMCWWAASTLADDPVPWIGLLTLASLDPTQIRPEHRVPGPDQMIPPGPWGLFDQVRRADPWNREAFHRVLRVWLARGESGAATNFLATYLTGAPEGSPLHALPLYLHVDRYRRAERKDAVLLQWTGDDVVRSTVLQAYENWRAAPGEQGRWPVTDEHHLAHALWATRHPRQAAQVFAALTPFVSSQPWVSLAPRPNDALRQAMAQSFAATR
ncbi:hypothetical protein P3T27_005937 [Kitasatospora sp. MAA19]|uniref:hypothetical protein n=1 Tax=unclassified Kitasatospora TaxID=2633591 RepID=UPI002474FA2A|nr:hypothetical protein [Kitasatospora sp. MAA19]MDH6709191.1 hypothetical protein [Kitasatospora sp. MAA19]